MDKEFQTLFQNPPAPYRGAPFWAWNCKLDRETMVRQVLYFKEMGMGGFHMHCRTGLDTEYLGEEFMEIIRACVEKAKEEDMLTWLYDEDRWPSGFGGGYVTRDPAFRSRCLVLSPFSPKERKNGGKKVVNDRSDFDHEHGLLLARYEVRLEDGFLAGYRRLEEHETAESPWYAYRELSLENPWYNNQTYVDTLNPKAIQRFVEVTHQRYYQVLGDEFGKTIPAIFTDEPQFSHKTTLGFAGEKKEVVIPYTDDFEDTYRERYGESFLDKLPEVFWELPGGACSVTRYRFHDHIAQRFAEAFAGTVGNWCREHGLLLTGHMMEEPTLQSQTCALGDTMRSYRSFGLPGIDMLCDAREYSTAKQAQSAAHQYGCPGVASELYGVTNWDFDFRSHKLAGDWQAALGVTTRVHHLSWASMEGEAKRDYPASIFYQSPWYREYRLIEDHFARLNTALTQGKPRVRVGVIHPVESYWLHFGPSQQTAAVRDRLEQQFEDVIQWLLFGLIDFDFLAESLLPEQSQVRREVPFTVGQMAYDAVVVPGCHTLRRTTLERLEDFAQAGGKVIFLGDLPTLVDARPDDGPRRLADQCLCIPFQQTELLAALEPLRELDIRGMDGRRTGNLLYQMREDGPGRWLFLANGKKPAQQDIPCPQPVEITLSGEYAPQVWDTLTGTPRPCPAVVKGGRTHIRHTFYEHDSLLLRLEPGRPQEMPAAPALPAREQVGDWKDKVPVTLSEPNVLLLDQAEYRLDGGPWQPREEVLRVDNLLREALGYPLKMAAFPQPWTLHGQGRREEHRLGLRFTVRSQLALEGVKLAVERPQALRVRWNGQPVSCQSDGWFTDEAIRTLPLPPARPGENILELEMPYGPATNVEWCYLLGDFGVTVAGACAQLTPPVRELAFGDWTAQGLPFYAGNVTYHCTLDTAPGTYQLETTKYRAPLVQVRLDGRLVGSPVFSPYTVELGSLEGAHKLDITTFGSRINAFGALHSCKPVTWCGPDAWRTEGPAFSYEYQLTPCGVLISPKLFRLEG